MRKQLLIIQLTTFLTLFFLPSITYTVGGDMGGGTESLTDGSESYPWLIEDFDDFEIFCGDPNYWASGIHTKPKTAIKFFGLFTRNLL